MTHEGGEDLPEETIQRTGVWTPPKGTLKSEEDAELTLDGKKVKCRKQSYEWREGEGGVDGSMALWISADARTPYREVDISGTDLAVPPGTLRMEFGSRKESAETKIVLEVTAVDRELQIAGKKVSCVVETVAIHEPKRELDIVRWLSADVPGVACKWTAKGKLKRGEFKSSLTVLDFEARR